MYGVKYINMKINLRCCILNNNNNRFISIAGMVELDIFNNLHNRNCYWYIL